MRYWLMKSEPGDVSIDDLANFPRQTVAWYGVRNYQARNFMRDDMKIGDMAIFHHSSTKIPGVCGVARVVSTSHPDLSAFDLKDEHYDAKSKKEKPTWICVDFAFVKKLPRLVSLEEIKHDHKLKGIMVAQTGSRLSIQPVSKNHFERILDLGNK